MPDLSAADAPAVVKVDQLVASVEYSSVPSHDASCGVIVNDCALEKVRYGLAVAVAANNPATASAQRRPRWERNAEQDTVFLFMSNLSVGFCSLPSRRIHRQPTGPYGWHALCGGG